MNQYYVRRADDRRNRQALGGHLGGVAGWCFGFAARALPGDARFAGVAGTTGLLHDLAKYCHEFQRHLARLRLRPSRGMLAEMGRASKFQIPSTKSQTNSKSNRRMFETLVHSRAPTDDVSRRTSSAQNILQGLDLPHFHHWDKHRTNGARSFRPESCSRSSWTPTGWESRSLPRAATTRTSLSSFNSAQRGNSSYEDFNGIRGEKTTVRIDAQLFRSRREPDPLGAVYVFHPLRSTDEQSAGCKSPAATGGTWRPSPQSVAESPRFSKGLHP